jgi:hypothetical protein
MLKNDICRNSMGCVGFQLAQEDLKGVIKLQRRGSNGNFNAGAYGNT